MNKTYKIDASKINVALSHGLKRTIILLLSALIFFFITTQINHRDGINQSSNYVSVLVSSLLLGLIILYSYNFKKNLYKNLEVIINEEGIVKQVNYDTLGQLGFIQQMLLNRSNRMSPIYNSILKWNEIVSMEEKNNNLCVKSATSNNFYGSGQILIPKEIDGYEEIKKIIGSHLTNNDN